MEPERFGEECYSNENYLMLNSVPEVDRLFPSLKIFKHIAGSLFYGLVYQQLTCSEEMKQLQNYMFSPKIQIFYYSCFGLDFFPMFIRISLKMAVLEMVIRINCEVIFYPFFFFFFEPGNTLLIN